MKESMNQLKKNLCSKSYFNPNELKAEAIMLQHDLSCVTESYNHNTQTSYNIHVIPYKNRLTRALFTKYIKYDEFKTSRMEDILWIDYIIEDLFREGIHIHIQRYLDIDEYLGLRYNICLYNYVMDYLGEDDDIYQMFKNIREFRRRI